MDWIDQPISAVQQNLGTAAEDAIATVSDSFIVSLSQNGFAASCIPWSVIVCVLVMLLGAWALRQVLGGRIAGFKFLLAALVLVASLREILIVYEAVFEYVYKQVHTAGEHVNSVPYTTTIGAETMLWQTAWIIGAYLLFVAAACYAARQLGCTSFLRAAADLLLLCLRVDDADPGHVIEQPFGTDQLDFARITRFLVERGGLKDLQKLWTNPTALEPLEVHWQNLGAVIDSINSSGLFPQLHLQETLARFEVLPVAMISRDDRMEVHTHQRERYLVAPLPENPGFRACKATLTVKAGVRTVVPGDHHDGHIPRHSWAEMEIVNCTTHLSLHHESYASALTVGKACVQQKGYTDIPGSLVDAINTAAGSRAEFVLHITSSINTYSHFIDYASLKMVYEPIDVAPGAQPA